MTNKKFRDDLAKEMRDKYNERNEKIEQLEKSSFSGGLKEQKRKEIMENFYKEMDKMKSRSGYEEARRTHLEEIKAKVRLNKSKKEYEEAQKLYEDAQMAHRGEVGEKLGNDNENSGELSQKKKEKLYGNREAILKDLKENGVKIEENVELMGHKGNKVYINLPAVGEFKGFKFEYFVSNESVNKKDFGSNFESEEKLYTMKEVSGLLWAMSKYMQTMGVETDGHMDYENDLKYWKTVKYRCDVGDCLKYISGLNDLYLLKDNENVAGAKGFRRAIRNCRGNICSFSWHPDNYVKLFLKLS